MSPLDTEDIEAYYKGIARRLDPMDQRLAREHILMDALCHSHSGVSYRLPFPDKLPPRDYRITFTGLYSILRVDSDQLPIFGDTHVLEIHLPSGFPAEAPICYMASEIWHPNIQSDEGPYQGRICGNTEGFGAFFSVDDLILRIESMLRYEIYHADLRFPYPEDETVARWVREYGEPLGIVRQGRGLIADGAMPADWRSFIRREQKMLIRMNGGSHG